MPVAGGRRGPDQPGSGGGGAFGQLSHAVDEGVAETALITETEDGDPAGGKIETSQQLNSGDPVILKFAEPPGGGAENQQLSLKIRL